MYYSLQKQIDGMGICAKIRVEYCVSGVIAMKKILGLLLACMLILSMTAALAEPANRIKLNLQGYAIGLNAEDTRLKWNGEWVNDFEYIHDFETFSPEVNKGYFALIEGDLFAEGARPATGPLEAGKQYCIEVIVPLSSQEEEDEAYALMMQQNFDVVNAYSEKEFFKGTIMPDIIPAGAFIIVLEPAPETLPATGDGAELMMWSAMVAFAAVGMVALSRKARREY